MDNELYSLIGRRLRAIRIEHGYDNQREFAELIDIDAPRLSRIEQGKRGIDTLVLRRAAQKLEVPMEAFFEEPQPELALARGDAEDPAQTAMLDWARTLQDNIATVERYVGARA